MKTYRQSGYTLVEIAIVMLIVGILLGSFLHLYTLYNEQTKLNETALTRTRINLALDDFKQRFGRYPCPARYDAKRDDPDYGREGNCADVSVLPGNCTNGYCIELSKNANVKLDDGTTITPRVRRGTIPFRTMYLTEDEMYDAYGGRFSYAVTEILTDWKTFGVNRGGISIVDNDPVTPHSVIDPPDSALYFVFSHGKDNVGAYNFDGALMAPCNGTMLDNENCNTSALDMLAVYRSSTRSDKPIDTLNAAATLPPSGPPTAVNANEHYDDAAVYSGLEEEPAWKYSETPGKTDDVFDLLAPTDKIAFGSAAKDQKVNVAGEVRTNVKTQSTQVCDQNGNNCFEPAAIGGAGIKCPAGKVAVGIKGTGPGIAPGSQMVCDDPANLVIDCTGKSGKFIIGFDPVSGEVQCADIIKPKDCKATTKKVCSVNKSLPASPHGTVITLTGGVSRVEPWRCNNGKWQAQTASGVCTCNPGSVTSAPIACGTGYNGTYTTTTTTVCPSGTTTTTDTFGSTCTCQGYTENGSQNCTAPWSGTQTRSRPWTCVGGVPKAGTWSAWGPACTCPPQAPKTTTVSCPISTYDGSGTKTSTLNTSSCSWGDTYDYSGCKCNVKTKPGTDICPNGETGTINYEQTLQCPSGTWGPKVEKSRNCSCVNKKITRSQSCPSGEIGMIQEEKLVDCHGNDIPGETWKQKSTSCKPAPVCKWKASGSAYPGTSSFGNPESGSTCTCGTAAGTCYSLIAPGIYQRYNCTCE